jgi:hypothetical protein
LTALLQDSSQRVRDAAERSLAEIGRSRPASPAQLQPQPIL